jgi:hypothetical protein
MLLERFLQASMGVPKMCKFIEGLNREANSLTSFESWFKNMRDLEKHTPW